VGRLPRCPSLEGDCVVSPTLVCFPTPPGGGRSPWWLGTRQFRFAWTSIGPVTRLERWRILPKCVSLSLFERTTPMALRRGVQEDPIRSPWRVLRSLTRPDGSWRYVIRDRTGSEQLRGVASTRNVPRTQSTTTSHLRHACVPYTLGFATATTIRYWGVYVDT